MSIWVPETEVVSLSHALEELIKDLPLHVAEMLDKVKSVVSINCSAHQVRNYFAKQLLVLIGVKNFVCLASPDHMFFREILNQFLQVVIVLILETLNNHVN